MRRATVAMATLFLLVTAACGPVGEPRMLLQVEEGERPMPANVSVAESLPESHGEAADDCGDPTASLAPDGLDVPAGSTMADIIDRGRLIVGVDQNTYLFGFRDPATGRLEGFDIDVAREIADALLGDSDKVQFKVVSVPERIEALVEGSVDLVVFMMTINCERTEDIEFSSVYFVAGQRVLVRKGSGYTALSDLGGEPVCAPRGSTSSVNIAAAEPQPVLVEVDNLSDCLVLLQQRQVEAISTDDTILAGMAQQDPTTEVVGEQISSEPYGIGIPKDNKDMVRYVNAVLEDIRDDRWRDVYRTWLEPALGPADPPKPVYQ